VAYHVIAPHFVKDYPSIMAARVVDGHGRFFPCTQILGFRLQTNQYEVNEVSPSEFFIRVKEIDGYQVLAFKTDHNHRF
jgi:hypothetical protein